MSGDGDDKLIIGEGFQDLPPGFINSILAPSDIIDTSPEGLAQLARDITGPLKPTLVSSRTAPVGSAARSSSVRPSLKLATVPSPLPAKPPAPLADSGLGFMEQITALTNEVVSPAELANAVFRVCVTPRNAKIDSRPDDKLLPNEKLAINSMAAKYARRTAPAALEEATQLAIWRGNAQPLRF